VTHADRLASELAPHSPSGRVQRKVHKDRCSPSDWTHCLPISRVANNSKQMVLHAPIGTCVSAPGRVFQGLPATPVLAHRTVLHLAAK